MGVADAARAPAPCERLRLLTGRGAGLGRAAAVTDQAIALDAEHPEISFGRARREKSAPLFLFPAVEAVPEVEWKAQSVRRYHGRINDLAQDLLRAQKGGSSGGSASLFVMPSLGV